MKLLRCRLFCQSSCARFENYAKLASLENVQLFEHSEIERDPMISWLRNFKAIGRSKNFDNMMKKHAMACTLCKNWAFQQNLLSPAKKLPSKRSDLQSKITTNTTSRKTAKKSGLACWKTWVKILNCLKTWYENCKSEILFWKYMVEIAKYAFDPNKILFWKVRSTLSWLTNRINLV